MTRTVVYTLEREFSGSNREIVAVAFRPDKLLEVMAKDYNRWTYPLTYHINAHPPVDTPFNIRQQPC